MSTPRRYGQDKFSRIGVRLTQEMKDALTEKCLRQGLTISHAVQDAISDWLIKQKGNREHE